jgi:hypothetical protein
VIALWIITCINSVALICLLTIRVTRDRRIRQNGSRAAEEEIPLGSRIPMLRCHRWSKEGVLSRSTIGTIRPMSVVVFVRASSVASFRLVELWLRLVKREQPGLPWTWVVMGTERSASRWVQQFDLYWCAVYCSEKKPLMRFVNQLPAAVYVDADRHILQSATINGQIALEQFVAGCPNKELRDWFANTSVAASQAPVHGGLVG